MAAGTVLVNPFAKPTSQPQNQSGIQQNQPVSQDGKPIQSGVIPPGDNLDEIDPTTGKKKTPVEDDPMMDFTKLWENPPIDPKNPPEPEETSFLPKFDPAKIAETLGKIDFSKSALPEELTAITAGGENATKAHISILNKSLRQAMMTMFNVNQRMVESGLTKAQERFLNQVPSHVKNIIVESDLTRDNPIMSNPAYAPLVESTRLRFQEKFPKATPAQVSNAVQKYLTSFVEAATKKEAPQVTDNTKKLKSGAGDADWEKWIEPELQQAL